MRWSACVAAGLALLVAAAAAAAGKLLAEQLHARPPQSSNAEPVTPTTATVALSGDTLSYVGPIEPPFVEEAKRLIERDPGVKVLAITSGGGDDEAGLDFAELLRARSIAVRVEDYCLITCANTVFVASRSRSISPHALVAFKWNIAAIYLLAKRRGLPIDPVVERKAQKFIADYRRWGLDPDLVITSFAAVRVECIDLSVADFDHPNISYRAPASMWMPSATQLHGYGLKGPIDGWPRSQPEFNVARETQARVIPMLRDAVFAWPATPAQRSALYAARSCSAPGRRIQEGVSLVPAPPPP